MNRKQAHQRKNRYSYYNRNSSTQWADDYTAEQLKWLWDNKHIEFSNPLYDLGETDNQKYIKFTKKGRRWRNWYSCSFKEYIKYYIIIDTKNYITYKLKKIKLGGF